MHEAIVIGVSAGGVHALSTVLQPLPATFPLPIAIVQHMDDKSEAYLADYLNRLCALEVKEAEDKEILQSGIAYLAPPGYHLLIEPDKSFSLSVDPKVNFSRPAIDVLFISAADSFGKNLIGIILTGANGDGTEGLKAIKTQGGMAIVQNPKTAEISYMPRSALEATEVDYIVDLEKIPNLLLQICKGELDVSDK